MAKKRTRVHQSSSLTQKQTTHPKKRKRWLSQQNAGRLLKFALLTADVVLRVLEAVEKLKGIGK